MRPRRAWLRRLAWLSLAAPLAAAAADPAAPPGAEPRRASAVPPPPADASSGSEFARRTTGWSGEKRQAAALAELRRGNVPDFLRALKPIRLEHRGADGSALEATLWVMPDYLAIGSDEDFLRIPLSLPSAIAIAEAFGMVLPTRKLVDAVHAQAGCRLEPDPLPPGPKMRSSGYYLRHREKIRERRRRRGCPLGELTAGHKKDVVLTGRLRQKPGRIAIYGWHRRSGRAIQPLSTVHDAAYADYSHGVRLVERSVWIDGAARSVLEVLEDPALAPLLTYEGEIEDPRALMGLQP